jgi:biotin carboxyl carrier protein
MNFERLRVVAGGVVHELDPHEIAPPDGARADEDREALVTSLPGEPDDQLTGRTRYEVVLDGWRFDVTVESAARAALRERAGAAAGGVRQTAADRIRAQLPGRIVAVFVAAGDQVTAGQPLVALEAMKMENEVRAPRAGRIATVQVETGNRVELGDELVVLE